MNVKTMCANAKIKLSAVADKVKDSKVYNAFERGAVAVGVGSTTFGVMAVNAFAETTPVSIDSIDPSVVLTNATPFINAGIPVLLVVSGVRLGWRFLRGSAH